jgi:hypothetical protein
MVDMAAEEGASVFKFEIRNSKSETNFKFGILKFSKERQECGF